MSSHLPGMLLLSGVGSLSSSHKVPLPSAVKSLCCDFPLCCDGNMRPSSLTKTLEQG